MHHKFIVKMSFGAEKEKKKKKKQRTATVQQFLLHLTKTGEDEKTMWALANLWRRLCIREQTLDAVGVS